MGLVFLLYNWTNARGGKFIVFPTCSILNIYNNKI